MCSWEGLLDFKSEENMVFCLLSGKGSASHPSCYFGESVHRGRTLHNLGSIYLLPQADHPLPTPSDRHHPALGPLSHVHTYLHHHQQCTHTHTHTHTCTHTHTHTHTHPGALIPPQRPLELPILRGQADRALGETWPGHTLENSASEPTSAAT